MPVGVPKVPYRVSGYEDSSWTDLYNRLYHQRVLFLGQEINYETSNQIAGLMVYLSIHDPSRDIFLLINSPGGAVLPGMGVFDTMRFIKPEVQTVCLGIAASMAALLLLGGQLTKRIAFPHSRIMIHEPRSVFFEEKIEICSQEANEIRKVYKTMIEIYVKITGRSAFQIAADMERDFFMSPEEAQAYGIIDIIAEED